MKRQYLYFITICIYLKYNYFNRKFVHGTEIEILIESLKRSLLQRKDKFALYKR